MAEGTDVLAAVERYEVGFGGQFAFAPDGRTWAAATTGIVHLWAADHLVDTIAVPGYLQGGIRFARQGASLRVGLWLVDIQSGATERSLPDGDLLVSALQDEAATHPELFSALSIDWNGDGSRAVVMTKYQPPRGLGTDYQHQGPPGQILLVDVAAGKVAEVLEADTGALGAWGVALCDRYVALGGPGVRVHDLDSGDQVADLTADGAWVAVRFSPDGAWLAAVQRGGTITLWSTSDWSVVASWPSTAPSAAVLAFDSSGRRLASAGRRGPVQIWSVGTTPEPVAAAPEEHGVQGLAFHPDGRLLVATTPPGQAIEVFQLR